MKALSIFSKPTPEESTGFVLWQVTTLWQGGIKKVLKPFGLAHSEFVVLASAKWLSYRQKSVKQAEIAKHSKLGVMHVSKILDQLANKALLVRQAHHDSRAKAVCLTRQGEQLVKKAVKAVEQFDDQFFAVLADKERDFRQLLMSCRG